jgi:hypothetical protein
LLLFVIDAGFDERLNVARQTFGLRK